MTCRYDVLEDCYEGPTEKAAPKTGSTSRTEQLSGATFERRSRRLAEGKHARPVTGVVGPGLGGQSAMLAVSQRAAVTQFADRSSAFLPGGEQTPLLVPPALLSCWLLSGPSGVDLSTWDCPPSCLLHDLELQPPRPFDCELQHRTFDACSEAAADFAVLHLLL
jgi:hypothetical protein